MAAVSERGRDALAECQRILRPKRLEREWSGITARERAMWLRLAGAADAVARGDHEREFLVLPETTRQAVIETMTRCAQRAVFLLYGGKDDAKSH